MSKRKTRKKVRVPIPEYSAAQYKRAVGFVLRKLRLKFGVTQEKAAAEVGMDRAHLARWEQGRYDPGSYRLIKLAAYYDCTVMDLFERIEKRAKMYRAGTKS